MDDVSHHIQSAFKNIAECMKTIKNLHEINIMPALPMPPLEQDKIAKVQELQLELEVDK